MKLRTGRRDVSKAKRNSTCYQEASLVLPGFYVCMRGVGWLGHLSPKKLPLKVLEDDVLAEASARSAIPQVSKRQENNEAEAIVTTKREINHGGIECFIIDSCVTKPGKGLSRSQERGGVKKRTAGRIKARTSSVCACIACGVLLVRHRIPPHSLPLSCF